MLHAEPFETHLLSAELCILFIYFLKGNCIGLEYHIILSKIHIIVIIKTKIIDKNKSCSNKNFEYWKDKLESYFLGLDGELWDLLMDGYKYPVKATGVRLTRQEMDDDQKKLFKNHHKCRTVLLNAISHAEYENISNRETAYDIYESLKM